MCGVHVYVEARGQIQVSLLRNAIHFETGFLLGLELTDLAKKG